MKTLIGSEKQIKWAEDIRKEYNHYIDTFGGEKVDCEDAKFWIEYGRVTNITYKEVSTRLEAYNFIRSNNFIDRTQTTLRQQSKDGLISRDAAMLIIEGYVK